MAKLKAVHDDLIEAFINDSRYTILESGVIMNQVKRLGYSKKTEDKLRGESYLYIKYRGVELKMHRIIYRKFNGKLHSKKVVHHIDANGHNNAATNLRLVSQQENCYFTWKGN